MSFRSTRSSAELSQPTWSGIHFVGAHVAGLLNGDAHQLESMTLHMVPRPFLAEAGLFDSVGPNTIFTHDHYGSDIYSPYSLGDSSSWDRSASPTVSTSQSEEAPTSGGSAEEQSGFDFVEFGPDDSHPHEEHRESSPTTNARTHELRSSSPIQPSVEQPIPAPIAVYPVLPHLHMIFPGGPLQPFHAQYPPQYMGTHFTTESGAPSATISFPFTDISAPPSRNNASTPGHIVCPYPGCTKTFTKPFTLRAHIKCHTADRVYKCESCDATFRRSHDVKRHFRSIHTVIKPFECKGCGKCFARMVCCTADML